MIELLIRVLQLHDALGTQLASGQEENHSIFDLEKDALSSERTFSSPIPLGWLNTILSLSVCFLPLVIMLSEFRRF